MPTPTGLLRQGDLIRHRRSGQIWSVLERCGTDACYAVKLIPHSEGAVLRPCDRSRGYMLLTETPYWLQHGWDLVH